MEQSRQNVLGILVIGDQIQIGICSKWRFKFALKKVASFSVATFRTSRIDLHWKRNFMKVSSRNLIKKTSKNISTISSRQAQIPEVLIARQYVWIYSDLPNNHAANLIIFYYREKDTYTTLLGPTRLLISDIFPSKPDFHLHKWEKILPTQPY